MAKPSAQILTGADGFVVTHNIGATKEPGEPDHAATVALHRFGFAGRRPQAEPLGSTRVTFLHWAFGPATNDNFATAQTLTGTHGTINACNAFATMETGEPLHGGNDGGNSIWYQWLAPATGVVEFDLAGSFYDTLLAVYRVDGMPAIDPLALLAQSNDYFDGFGLGFHTRVEFSVTEGAVYYVAVDGANDGRGYISDGWLVMSYDFSPVPLLQFTCAGQNLIINWDGPYTIESTPDLDTVWTPVPGTPPVSVPVTSEGNWFFRAVHP
jgi:hypothetical protein